MYKCINCILSQFIVAAFAVCGQKCGDKFAVFSLFSSWNVDSLPCSIPPLSGISPALVSMGVMAVVNSGANYVSVFCILT